MAFSYNDSDLDRVHVPCAMGGDIQLPLAACCPRGILLGIASKDIKICFKPAGHAVSHLARSNAIRLQSPV
jgi:hypothetical protein